MKTFLAQKIKTLFALLIASSLTASSIVTGSHSVRPTSNSPEKTQGQSLTPTLDKNYGKLPLAFEPNRGQANRSVKFLSHGSGYLLTLSSTEATLALALKSRLSNFA